MKTFEEVYQIVQPHLQGKEEERLEVIKMVRKGRRVHIIGSIAAIAAVWLFTQKPPGWLVIVLGIVALGGVIANIYAYFGIYGPKLNRFKEAMKVDVIGGIIKGVSEELNYDPNAGIPKSVFEESEIFKSRINRYNTEDRIWGRMGKTDIEIAEVKAERKETTRDSNGNTKTKYVTVFEGIFMVADFHKDFNGVTHVLPDMAESMFGWLGRKMQNMNWSRGKVARMEDPDFEKAFVVYTDDQVEARYILSTSMMRRMLALKERYQNNVAFAFMNSKVYIAITNKDDYFEPDYKKSLQEKSTIQYFYDELSCCLTIVEDLNLNTRIWSKQEGL